MNRATLTALVLAGAPAPLLADGMSYWLWDVTTNDGDSTVEPGETATVTISLLMESDPGDADITAFGAAIFDVLGDAGAAQGYIIGWEVLNNLDELTGDLTTSDGVSLYNINAGQLPTFGPFNYDNPIDVIEFSWQPDAYAPFEVGYQTDSVIPDEPHTAGVWEDPYDQDGEFLYYPVAEAGIAFDVIPTPGAPAALALAATAALRRRRRP